MKPLVSVIIPTYNARRFVAQAVRSALEQSFDRREVIVIDDGSTDDTGAVLAEFAGRIRYHVQPNRGVYAARNAGIRMAEGEFVSFLDADDLWLPDKLARQVEILQAHPDFGAVHTDAALIDADGRVLKASSNSRRQSLNGMVFDEFFRSNMAVILLSTVLIRKSCFDVLGCFDERFPTVQDYHFFLRLAWRYPIWFIPQPLIRYRITPGSLSRANAAQNIAFREQLLREFIEEHRDHFAARQRLLRKKWQSFNLDAGIQLYHRGNLRASRRYLRKALASGPRAWLYWLATWAWGGDRRDHRPRTIDYRP